MKHPIFAVATTATFVAGVIVGHYAMPRSVRLSAPALNAANEISTRSSERTSPTLSISAPNQFDPAAPLSENIIGAIENAAAHPGNRQLYSEVNDLIENLDPKDVRPVIDAIQHLPISVKEIRLCRCSLHAGRKVIQEERLIMPRPKTQRKRGGLLVRSLAPGRNTIRQQRWHG